MMSTDAINVRDFLSGPGSDCGPAIERAIEACIEGAKGTVYFPPGDYPVRTGINIPPAGIQLVGDSTPWWKHASTKIQWNGEGPLFSLSAPEDNSRGDYNGFMLSGLAFHGRHFGNDFLHYRTNRHFSQDFRFCRIGTNGFRRVFDVSPAGVDGDCRVWGRLLLDSCVMHWNHEVFVTAEARINQATFFNCMVRQNNRLAAKFPLAYVISLYRPHDVVFDRCNFEGQPRVLRVDHGSTLDIRQCYWEQHESDAVVEIAHTDGLHFGRQQYRKRQADGVGPKFVFRSCPDAAVESQGGQHGPNIISWSTE